MNHQILHITQQLSLGGAGRAIVYLAKYSRAMGPYSHAVLSLLPIDDSTRAFASQNNIVVYEGTSHLADLVNGADIIQVSWWNNVEVYSLLRSSLPPSRMIGWFHCGGQSLPHIITNKLAGYFDVAAACSPYTLRCPAIDSLRADPARKVAMILGATDFQRLEQVSKKVHSGFNCGYIGTIDFVKMHAGYVQMSAAANIPDVRFVICGTGSALPQIMQSAAESSKPNAFCFMGQVENIGEALSTFDVYGYPLCPDTYAASELNLQEAMYVGIPPVVFPYGGIQDLVQHNQTGLIVHSPDEYTQAIEYLYRNRSELQRLGDNARAYAKSHFGAENAARAANDVYSQLLTQPKTAKVWDQRLEVEGSVPATGSARIYQDEGAAYFIDSLGQTGRLFVDSMIELDPVAAFKADLNISRAAPSLRSGGIDYYRIMYPQSAYLNYWSGIAALQNGLYGAALGLIGQAVQLGLNNWKTIVALMYAARAAGNVDLGTQVQQLVENELFNNIPPVISASIRASHEWKNLSV